MSDVLDTRNIDIPTTIENLSTIIHLYQNGKLTKKDAAKTASKILSKLKKFVPDVEKRELYDQVVDICISLTTIDRAEPKFEAYYLASLKEEIEKVKSM